MQPSVGIFAIIVIVIVTAAILYLMRRSDSADSTTDSSATFGSAIPPQAPPSRTAPPVQSSSSVPPSMTDTGSFMPPMPPLPSQSQAPAPEPAAPAKRQAHFDEETDHSTERSPAPAATPVAKEESSTDDYSEQEKSAPAGPGTTNIPIPPPAQAPIQAPKPPTVADQTTAPTPTVTPTGAIPTETVRFTAFHPKEIAVDTWYTMLVYTHIEAALSRVQTDAARYKDEMGSIPRESRSGAPAQLARGTEISILPQMDGVEFNPERITFKWVEDMHRAEFRLRASSELAGLAGNGTVSIFVGPLIVATIRFGMLFEEPNVQPIKLITNAQTTTHLYKAEQIFASYSHKDSDVVLACRDAYKALGYDVLIDIDTLRSGEKWHADLLRMIDQADIFQLFWSKNSSESQYCRQEWEYAVKKSEGKAEGFIRPVYWEKPLVNPPTELEDLHFAYVPLPKSNAIQGQ